MKRGDARRYWNMNAAPIPLVDALDPPAKINPDYIQQPGNSRKCILCGKMHDTIVENTMTGERIEELVKCYRCLMEGYFDDKSDLLKRLARR